MLSPQEIPFTLATSVLLYEVVLNLLENVQKHFLTKFLQVKKQKSYILLLLETRSLPIETMTMERVVEYMLKVQKSPSHQLPRIAWEASKNIQKTHKSKILCSGWMQDMEMVW